MTSHLLRGFSLRGSCIEAGGLAGMAGETDDPEDAAARLEAALERIARRAGSQRPDRDPPPAASVAGGGTGGVAAEMIGPAPPVEEIAARLDGLIDRLRAALTTSPGGRPG